MASLIGKIFLSCLFASFPSIRVIFISFYLGYFQMLFTSLSFESSFQMRIQMLPFKIDLFICVSQAIFFPF